MPGAMVGSRVCHLVSGRVPGSGHCARGLLPGGFAARRVG